MDDNDAYSIPLSSSSSYSLSTIRGGGDDYFDSDADSYIAAAGSAAGAGGNSLNVVDNTKKRKLSEASGGGGGGPRSAASSVSSRTSRRSPANVPMTKMTTTNDKSSVEQTRKKPKSNADVGSGNVDSDDDDDKSFDNTTRVKEHGRHHATWSARGNLNFQATTSSTTIGGGSAKTMDGVIATAAPHQNSGRLNSISESDDIRRPDADGDSSNKLLSLSSAASAAAATATATSSSQQQQRRWRSHQIAEDYISLASSITLPPITSSNIPIYGYDTSCGQYPIEQGTTLGYLTSTLRRPQTILERWNPYEISIFEGAIAIYGKKFHTIAKYLQQNNNNNSTTAQGSNSNFRKCTKDVIEFYYIWKKTSHGRRWKSSYVNEILESDDDDDNDTTADELAAAADNNNRDSTNTNYMTNTTKKEEEAGGSNKSNGPVATGGGGVERGVV